MVKHKKKIDIIVPCYNEEACISLFYTAIKKIFQEKLREYDFNVIYVDDGSKDNTLQEIKEIVSMNPQDTSYISFSRNFGKEAALYVGFEKSTGDYVVPMDADLQHPPTLLVDMVRALEEGYDCAAAVRVSREGEPFFRSLCAKTFYFVANKISGIDMVQGSTDYRMMTRQVVEAIVSFGERERFTKGVYSWVGFKTKWIEYENVERVAGNTKWSFKGLMNYGINGFVAFTTTPLRAATWMGMSIVGIAILYAIYTIIHALIHPELTTGRATTILIMLLLGGVIISILGIIGEYLARIYMEVKRRPIYIIKESNIDKFENSSNDMRNNMLLQKYMTEYIEQLKNYSFDEREKRG